MLEGKIIHLANVLAIAEADGAVDSAEEAVFEAVVDRLGVSAREISQARLFLAQNRPFQLRDIEPPAAAMAAIEDMIMMSMADGRVKAGEARALEAYCERLGYVQADIDMMARRVRVRMDQLGLMPQPATARAVPPLPPTAVRPVSPKSGPSSSPKPAPQSAKPAPQLAKTAPPKPVPAPAAPVQEPEKVAAPASRQDAPPAAEASVAQAPAWQVCARRRAQAPQGPAYCFGAPQGPLNPWGCRLLDMPWADAAWLRLGQFRADGVFFFDHEAVARELEQVLTEVVACPYLKVAFIEAVLAELPQRAAPDGNWAPHPTDDGTGYISLVCDVMLHGCGLRQEVEADGLVPRSNHFALRAIRRAARKQGIKLDLALLGEVGKGDDK